MHDALKGDDGEIPPIYQDIADALHATSQRFHRVNATLTEKLRHDAAALLKTVQRHGDIQHEAAHEFHDDVDTFASAANTAAAK
jgi:glucose-6-phosphate-specific signal transduction histidine kinase